MENRNGLLVDLRIATANGTAERDVALPMLDEELRGVGRLTMGGDEGYDTIDFIPQCRERNVIPHVAQNITARRDSAIDPRTLRIRGKSADQEES